MKKTLILFAVTILCAISCTEEPIVNPYAVEPTISVVKSDVLFPVRASSGTIVVDAKGAYTVSCSANWVNTSVNGDTVTVSVGANTNINGRTAIIVLTCGDYSVEVCVQQIGVVYNNESISYEGGSFKIKVSEIGSYTIDCPDTWISYVANGDYLEVTVDPNTTPKDRISMFVIKTSGDDIIYMISQNWQFDVSGNYKLYYYNSKSATALDSLPVVITRSDTLATLYYITGIDDYKIAAYANEDEATLDIINAQYLSKVGDVYHYLTIYYSSTDGASYYYSVSTDPKYYTSISISFNEDTGKYELALKDTGKAIGTDRTAQGFQIRSFTTPPSETLATANVKSTIKTFCRFYLNQTN